MRLAQSTNLMYISSSLDMHKNEWRRELTYKLCYHTFQCAFYLHIMLQYLAMYNPFGRSRRKKLDFAVFS